jgi:uncharacterized protein (DUF1697 family)
MNTFVALLRGINVGGQNKVPMPELRSLFASLGLADVATYIQSGNVVFTSPTSDAQDLAASLERRIAEVFGVRARVLMRTAAELEAIAQSNPFPAGKADPTKLHVVFLDRAPAPSAVAALDPGRSPPDEFSVRGREIYLHLPTGAARSKLTIDYFEGRLGVTATARNWNTVTRLLGLTRR